MSEAPFKLPGLPGAGVPTMKVIRPHRCELCKWSSPAEEQGLLDCHFGPPSVNGVFMGMGKNPATGQTEPMMMAHTAFPKMQPTDWCGQFFSRLAQ